MSKENPMQKIFVEKITLNVGAGKDEQQLKKGLLLLQKFSSLEPVKTKAKSRNPTWGLRPGLAIGCKVTIRKGTGELLERFFTAREKKLQLKSFDNYGNFSFGIPEYIDIPGLEYDPDLKIMGFEVAVTLTRKGHRVKKRKLRSFPIGKKQAITKDQAVAFIKERFGVEVEA